ncbi:uncharacterized protein LOC128234733 isoform X2 [Mya arenaria]|uniref:uncharacterized protein LOC128234733 isoform X2 n=1 Tax=Mya arenaria TaxID=6604 RepID=UPI0022E46426|nr:uncharacterized protein LOC128234733 isoform X2 [Mya arenaria]
MDLFIRKMKISIYVLGFALFKLDIYTKGQSLYISNNETSWAKVNCNLAIPNLTFTEFGLLPKHVQNITNDDLKKGVWIGLFKARLSFAYIGCNKINADSILVKAKDLSECRWKTGCDTIAVRRFNDETIECQCGNSSDLQHEHECTSRCGSGDEYPCGDSGKAHFAIYTVENVSISSENDNDADRGCLKFRSNGSKKFIWWKCYKKFNWRSQILCSDRPSTEDGATVDDISDEDNDWAIAGNKCFAKDMYPATMEHIMHMNISSEERYWTGIIRMTSIIRRDETFITYPPKRFAYITVSGDQLHVEFGDDLTVKRKSLCKKVARQVPIMKIAVGLSAGILLLVLIIIGVVLWKRNKIHCLNRGDKTLLENEIAMQVIDTRHKGPGTSVRSHAYPNHDFSGNQTISTKPQTFGDSSLSDTCDDPCDENNQRDIQQRENVYNFTNQQVEEYDTLNHSGIRNHVISQPINDYDSMSNCNEDTYDHLDEQQEPNTDTVYRLQSINEHEEAYNHLNMPSKKGQSKNTVYGFKERNQHENPYTQLDEQSRLRHNTDDVYESQDRNEQEDTYNNLVGQSKQRHYTDNVNEPQDRNEQEDTYNNLV